MNALSYLIATVFDIFLMAVILRVWLQLVKADFYNPFSQIIVKVTQPILAPMRRIIPSAGALDTASILLALTVVILKIFLLTLISNKPFDFGVTVVYAVVSVIKQTGMTLFWILIIQVILSWVSQGRNPVEFVLMQLTAPLLSPIRRVIPPMGGLDFSILILMVAMNFINLLFMEYVPFWAFA